MTIKPFYSSVRAKFTQRIPLYHDNDTSIMLKLQDSRLITARQHATMDLSKLIGYVCHENKKGWDADEIIICH